MDYIENVCCHICLQCGLFWAGWANQIWLRRPFFVTMEEILNERSRWYYVKYYLIVVFSLIFSCRSFILTLNEGVMELTLHNGHQYSALVFVDEIFGRDDGNIAFFTLIHGFFFIFNAAIQGFFHLTKTDSPVWQTFEDILVRNVRYCKRARERTSAYQKAILVKNRFDQIQQSVFERRLPLFVQRMIVNARVWFNQDFLDREYLLQQKFVLFGDIEFDFRRKAQVYLDFVEIYNLITLNIYYVFEMLMLHYYYDIYIVAPTIRDNFWFGLFWTELTLLCFYCLNSVNSGLLMVCVSFFGTLFSIAIMQPLNARLRQNMFARRLGRVKNMHFRKVISKFVVIHTRSSYIIRFVNEAMWSRLVLIGLGINLPVNIYFLSSVTIYRVAGVKLWFCFVILCIQVLIMGCCMLPIAQAHYQYHCSHKILCTAQWLLSAGSINRRLRLKTQMLYERITSKCKYGIRVGQFGTITNWLIFRTCLLYIAYFLTFTNSLSDIRKSAKV